MNRVGELMRNLFVPTSLRGIRRNYNSFVNNYLKTRNSGYEEIGAEPDTNRWIKLIIYLGSAVAIILSIVAFSFGYVIIPAISTLTAVICATLFWFRYSAVWGRLLECSRVVFCFPCIFFKRPVLPNAEIVYQLRNPDGIFERSVEAHANDEEAQSDVAEDQSEEQNQSSIETVAESESSVTINTKPVEQQNAKQ